ncbi:uncharacterized protein LOC121377852 [Gigantopelta aegis]|uniref:uncharacterized protein LOC121377852 n=1 Tax=Gigantopelta aegis TaxID=1735272 RepID=UPI001B88757A|nr:uncharacterized protein LOC121377852 [Gigantopelta aegis]
MYCEISEKSRQEGWEVGRTKVFLPLWGDSTLDSLLDQEVRHVVVVQSVARGFLVRRWFGRLAQTQDTHALQLSQLADDIFQNGGRAFYAQREQRDHDRRKYDRYIHGHDQHRRSRRSQHSPRYDRWGNPVDAHIESSRYSRRTSYDSDDIEDFQERVLRSVIGRKEELDTSTWCKVICMEYEREVGKVYVQEKEFIVDGSYNKFDGQRLGLGVFQNSDRDKLTEDIRGAIMEGVALSKDAEGNIWAKRLSRNDVIAKGYHDPGNHCLSAEVVLQKGRLPYQEQVKIFDAREFKSHMGLHMKGKKKGRLEFLSLIGLSFIQDKLDDLDTPCWVCLVNILALTALESNDVLQEVEMMIAGVHLKTEEETEEESNKMVVKKRHHRNSWSKTDHRDHLNAKDSPRKLREMLRRQGDSVSTHMDYSWNRQPSGYAGNMMTVDDLHEMADQEQYGSHPDVLGRRNSKQRDWAKVKVTLKEMSAKQTEETEAAQKTMYTRY